MGAAIFLVFILLLLGVVFFAMSLPDSPNSNNDKFENQLREAIEHDSKHADYSFDTLNYHIYIMGDLEAISLYNDNSYRMAYFSAITKIIPIEFTNNESTKGHALGGAAVGGLLAGGVGAVVGATAGSKTRNYTRVRELGYIIEAKEVENGDVVDRYEIVILKDSTDENRIRKAYETYDRLGLAFKSYLADKIIN